MVNKQGGVDDGVQSMHGYRFKATPGRLPTKPTTLILQTIRKGTPDVHSRGYTCVACDKIIADREQWYLR